MLELQVISPLRPAGDQPAAIAKLAAGIRAGMRTQTLLGITGSGKSATVAWTIEQVQKPTLVLEPNKSLAAQLAGELRELFPRNRVEFFVSYYDYYQPEAYVPASDTYIEKDSSVNDEIDRLRHSATSALLTRRDVIVVASVSAIYGLGSPAEYRDRMLTLSVGQEVDQRAVLRRLVELRYDRNEAQVARGTFRVRGDILEIHAAYDETVVRISLLGDTVESIRRVDLMLGEVLADLDDIAIFPATHYVATDEVMRRAIAGIEDELRERLAWFHGEGKLLEEQRLRMRTEHDLEMMGELGYCNGIENYSRHIDGRNAGQRPYTLLDYFPDDFLVVVDESHVSVPQLHGQYAGDRSRKETLVEHGFRLPSALDNRPLRFEEFVARAPQIVYLSATPSPYELEVSEQVVEQIVRPTGLVDPKVELRPTAHQIDDLLGEIRTVVGNGDRVLVTTLTKKMAEELAEYLADAGVRVRYLHSTIDTIERIQILRDLRLAAFDVLVGVNLLREGLDLPEVALVGILDADKEGFLRSTTSLVQTIGRAARNVSGKVLLYADRLTDSMRAAMSETERRRRLQEAFNAEHGIDPQTVRKAVVDLLGDLSISVSGHTGQRRTDGSPIRGRGAAGRPGGRGGAGGGGQQGGFAFAAELPGEIAADLAEVAGGGLPDVEIEALVVRMEERMRSAAAELQFEVAARLRDEIRELRRELRELRALT